MNCILSHRLGSKVHHYSRRESDHTSGRAKNAAENHGVERGPRARRVHRVQNLKQRFNSIAHRQPPESESMPARNRRPRTIIEPIYPSQNHPMLNRTSKRTPRLQTDAKSSQPCVSRANSEARITHPRTCPEKNVKPPAAFPRDKSRRFPQPPSAPVANPADRYCSGGPSCRRWPITGPPAPEAPLSCG